MSDVIDSRIGSLNCTLFGCDGFDIRLREDSVGVTVAVRGEVDLATVPVLMRALLLAAVGGPPLVVIDASGMSFIGSTGLSVILAARRSLRSRSGTLKIRNPSRMLDRTLAIAGITDLTER
jgi:anti-sigma B factor antagonist